MDIAVRPLPIDLYRLRCAVAALLRAQLSTRPLAVPELVGGIVRSLEPVRSVVAVKATNGHLLASSAGPADSRHAVTSCQPSVASDG